MLYDGFIEYKFQAIESEVLNLVKSTFQSFPNLELKNINTTEYAMSMLAGAEKLRKNILNVYQKQQSDIMISVNNILYDSFANGYKTANNQMNVKAAEEEHPSLQNTRKGQELIANANNSILQAEATSISDIMSKVISSIALISSGAFVAGINQERKLYDIIDENFLPNIENGLVGKVATNGARLELSNYTESVTSESGYQCELLGQGQAAKEQQQYLVQISAHAGCCDLCLPYQNAILIDDVFADGFPDGKHELLSTAMSLGLFHWNCRHKKRIYKEGGYIAENPLNYDKDKVKETYAIEQTQRELERRVRKYKRLETTALTADKQQYYSALARRNQGVLNSLVKVSREKGFAVYRQNWKEQSAFEFDKFKPYDQKRLETVKNVEISNNAIKFVPAKTKKEAEKFVQDVLNIPKSNYGKNSIETMNEWNKGLQEVFNKFPELKEKFQFVGDCRERNKVLKPKVEEYYKQHYSQFYDPISQKVYYDRAVKSAVNKQMHQYQVSNHIYAQSLRSNRYGEGAGITINSDMGSNYNSLIDSCKKDVNNKFHPVGCDTIKSILDHEVGHQLDEMLNISKDAETRALFNKYSRNEMTEKLSMYAWQNGNSNKYGEFIAEGWAEYCNNSTPREIANEIGNIIERRYREWKK